jgi:hypothetical protein
MFQKLRNSGIRALNHCGSGLIAPAQGQRQVANRMQLPHDFTVRMHATMRNGCHVKRWIIKQSKNWKRSRHFPCVRHSLFLVHCRCVPAHWLLTGAAQTYTKLHNNPFFQNLILLHDCNIILPLRLSAFVSVDEICRRLLSYLAALYQHVSDLINTCLSTAAVTSQLCDNGILI